MKLLRRCLALLLLAMGLLHCGDNTPDTLAEETPAPQRIISLNGTLTELLYDLDYGDRLVGVDVTSVYPPEADDLPKLGHVSQLNVEGLLELKPTTVFIDAEHRDKPALRTLAEAGVDIISITLRPTLDNAAAAAGQLRGPLNLPAAEVAAYNERIQQDSLSLARHLAGTGDEKPAVLFIYARGAKQLMVAGTDTEAAAMIELAGGRNAISSFADFKPLTPEALVEAAPDVILLFESGLKSLDGKDGLANIPGIRQTPAFKNDRIIAMDGHYLLGFGPHAARAATELAAYLHPAASK